MIALVPFLLLTSIGSDVPLSDIYDKFELSSDETGVFGAWT